MKSNRDTNIFMYKSAAILKWPPYWPAECFHLVTSKFDISNIYQNREKYVSRLYHYNRTDVRFDTISYRTTWKTVMILQRESNFSESFCFLGPERFKVFNGFILLNSLKRKFSQNSLFREGFICTSL